MPLRVLTTMNAIELVLYAIVAPLPLLLGAYERNLA